MCEASTVHDQSEMAENSLIDPDHLNVNLSFRLWIYAPCAG